MKIITQETLINSLNISRDSDILFLLGAGCSINSGCMAASKLVLEFKRRLYCAKYGIHYDDTTLINDVFFAEKLKEEFDDSSVDNPYSYYFEKCFPNSVERNIFIKEKFEAIKPSYGYLCFAHFLIEHKVKHVLTTNFDKLIEKAILKINDKYDFTVTSDNLHPVLSADINIVKLHGDYNYDGLKNTEEELKALSENLQRNILAINTRKIVVMGYSGQDNSVMSLLNKIVNLKPGVEIVWCNVVALDDNNEKVKEFLRLPCCSYCQIKGFDGLFEKLYKVYGRSNISIDKEYENIRNDNFILNVNHQPEEIVFNCNFLQESPSVYRVKYAIDSVSLKKINEESNLYIDKYKEYMYFTGCKEEFSKILNIPLNLIELVDLCEQKIPLVKKCKIIKEIIKQSKKKQGYKIFKDNIYIDSDNSIKTGLHINIEIFDGKICLITNVNYFVCSQGIRDVQKYEINRLKSNLYASKNYELRLQLINKILGIDLCFEYFGSKVAFSSMFMGNKSGGLFAEHYNCSLEPAMRGEKYKSTNQIKILTEYGPRKTLFTLDKIKVGVFCAEENKAQLKTYLKNLIEGTSIKGSDIIPKYNGFETTFNKRIEVIYDALPQFYAEKICAREDFDIDKFAAFCVRGIEKMYNERQIDIALIYVGDNFKNYRTSDGKDLHDIIKLTCANRYKTQFLEEKTINSIDNINKKILNLAIGIYTKTIGMSWYPDVYSKDTLFLGISFGVDSEGINVGCSQMFDGAGRGMQLIISQVSDKHRQNQYLSQKEAYDLGVKIRATYYRTSKINELKRIVIHRADPFRSEEIEGFKKAFEGIDDFALIQITDYTFFNSYRFSNGKCFGYPVKRGTVIKTSKDTAYVWTDGSVNNSDILDGKTYRNNKRGMGKPLKIRKFYGKTSINEVVDDLMYLTKMDFNSSDVIYSKLPVTLKYSKIVCDLLKQGKIEDDLISFEYVM